MISRAVFDRQKILKSVRAYGETKLIREYIRIGEEATERGIWQHLTPIYSRAIYFPSDILRQNLDFLKITFFSSLNYITTTNTLTTSVGSKNSISKNSIISLI